MIPWLLNDSSALERSHGSWTIPRRGSCRSALGRDELYPRRFALGALLYPVGIPDPAPRTGNRRTERMPPHATARNRVAGPKRAMAVSVHPAEDATGRRTMNAASTKSSRPKPRPHRPGRLPVIGSARTKRPACIRAGAPCPTRFHERGAEPPAPRPKACAPVRAPAATISCRLLPAVRRSRPDRAAR
jgi:hypothetical protein